MFKRNINITKSDLCVILNTDILFVPYVRQFVYLERFCPIKKVNYKYTLYRHTSRCMREIIRRFNKHSLIKLVN